MTRSLLKIALACLCLLLGLAAVHGNGDCPHRRAKIPCCDTMKAKYDNKNRITKYTCSKCDDGFKPTKNKEQCSSKTSCKKGTGPPVNGMGDKCVPCSDQNCADCHQVRRDLDRRPRPTLSLVVDGGDVERPRPTLSLSLTRAPHAPRFALRSSSTAQSARKAMESRMASARSCFLADRQSAVPSRPTRSW